MGTRAISIKTVGDLNRAVAALDRANPDAAAVAHIIKRAKALGIEDALPDDFVRDAMVECEDCGGTGMVDGKDCPTCDGEGEVDENDLEDAALTTQFTDSVPLELMDGKLRKTADGYLVGIAKVARTGIQVYKGYELGKPDIAEVRVYRPPEQVFAKDAMHSMAHRPTTLLHPKMMVDASNWRDHATGHTGDEIVRDGDSVKVPLVVMDQRAIDAYEKDGVKELSMGYTTNLVWRKGKLADGQVYDAVQTDIRANHLAIVPVARAGSDFRLGDEKRTNGANSMAKIIVDGLPVDVADENSATIITRHIDKVEKKLADAKKELSAKEKADEDEDKAAKAKDAAAKTALDAKDGEIVALRKQLEDAVKASSPEAIQAKAREMQSTIDSGRALLDKAYVFDGKKIEDIRRDAVKVKLGDDAVKAMSDDAITGAFKILTADAAKGGTGGVQVLADGIQRSLHSNQQQRGSTPVRDALNERDKGYTEAWRGGNKANGAAAN